MFNTSLLTSSFWLDRNCFVRFIKCILKQSCWSCESIIRKARDAKLPMVCKILAWMPILWVFHVPWTFRQGKLSTDGRVAAPDQATRSVNRWRDWSDYPWYKLDSSNFYQNLSLCSAFFYVNELLRSINYVGTKHLLELKFMRSPFWNDLRIGLTSN